MSLWPKATATLRPWFQRPWGKRRLHSLSTSRKPWKRGKTDANGTIQRIATFCGASSMEPFPMHINWHRNCVCSDFVAPLEIWRFQVSRIARPKQPMRICWTPIRRLQAVGRQQYPHQHQLFPLQRHATTPMTLCLQGIQTESKRIRKIKSPVGLKIPWIQNAQPRQIRTKIFLPPVWSWWSLLAAAIAWESCCAICVATCALLVVSWTKLSLHSGSWRLRTGPSFKNSWKAQRELPLRFETLQKNAGVRPVQSDSQVRIEW